MSYGSLHTSNGEGKGWSRLVLGNSMSVSSKETSSTVALTVADGKMPLRARRVRESQREDVLVLLHTSQFPGLLRSTQVGH